ncbi:MAG TPA: S41 family peptidase [Anaerolineae bacterium]|nr:S41 family peptidase [Anaerolineae bacterium]HXW00895.1 S41 family peptidase [Anaerolineae bacterium]
MKKLVKIIVIAFSVLIITAASFGAGVLFANSDFLKPGVVRAADQPAEFEMFWQVWNIVQNHFVDREALNPTNLTYGAINGLITALGDEGHTRFLTPDEVAQQQTNISGKFYGIGAHVGVENGLPVIVAPFDDSPADKAGVKAGDIIIEVNGEDVTTLPLNEVVERIRGEEGTDVTIAVFRPDANESFEFTITRAEINIPAALWAMAPGTKVALIRMTQFSANLNDELLAAIKEAEAAGATELVVDVRNNPGGLLEQAVKVTSQFLKSGNVLLQEDAQGGRETFPVKAGGVATDIPVVVLINRGSASAAEIFAGAIQDHKRGQVVGETTFGTGTVLQPFELDGGAGLLLGTSQWLTPNGRLIRKQGIEPDVQVDVPIGADLITPPDLENMNQAELLQSEDTQLLKALELLKAIPEVSTQPETQPELDTSK